MEMEPTAWKRPVIKECYSSLQWIQLFSASYKLVSSKLKNSLKYSSTITLENSSVAVILFHTSLLRLDVEEFECLMFEKVPIYSRVFKGAPSLTYLWKSWLEGFEPRWNSQLHSEYTRLKSAWPRSTSWQYCKGPPQKSHELVLNSSHWLKQHERNIETYV